MESVFPRPASVAATPEAWLQGILVVTPKIWFNFLRSAAGDFAGPAQRLDVMGKFHEMLFDPNMKPLQRFVIEGATGLRLPRIAILFQPRMEFGPVPQPLSGFQPPNASEANADVVLDVVFQSGGPPLKPGITSPARNSRVAVRGRPLSSVHRVVSLEAAPRLVLTNDAGDHVVLDYGERYEVRTADGAVTAHDSKMSEPALLVWPHSLIVDDSEHDFAGGARTVAALMTRTGSNDTAWAIEVGEKTATYIVQQHASEYASTEPVPGTDVGARAWNKLQMKLVVDSIVFYTSHASDTRVWTQEFEGGGWGAVGTDRFIAVATTDQRFVAYDANAGRPSEASRRSHSRPRISRSCRMTSASLTVASPS